MNSGKLKKNEADKQEKVERQKRYAKQLYFQLCFNFQRIKGATVWEITLLFSMLGRHFGLTT